MTAPEDQLEALIEERQEQISSLDWANDASGKALAEHQRLTFELALIEDIRRLRAFTKRQRCACSVLAHAGKASKCRRCEVLAQSREAVSKLTI